MNLREQAAADMRGILEDSAAGFASVCVVTSPWGKKATLRGIFRDIDLAIDTQTGEAVAGHTASIVISKPSLAAVGFQEIRNIPEEDSAPWVIELTDMGGAKRTFKVSDTPTDELGAVTCMLEAHKLI